MRQLVIAVALIAAVPACGSRCRDVDSARTALTSRAAGVNRGFDVRVTLPLAPANAVIADLLKEQPVVVPLELPDLGPLSDHLALTATARDVKLQAGPVEMIRFAVQLDIREAENHVTTLAMVIDVAPKLEKTDGGAELSAGFGAENLVSIKPVLDEHARTVLGDVVERRLPERLRGKLPRAVLDAGAARLTESLSGAAFEALKRTLLLRLGELTRMRLRLPEVPIGHVAIRSTSGVDESVVVEIRTDLAVRRGLAPVTPGTVGSGEIAVELSGSTVAELANWTIANGYLPRWYDRGLAPRTDGEFTPRFDYVAEDTEHPFKVYAFQERGGCSYFRVGVQAAVAIDGDKLVATALDRSLEGQSASPLIEAGAWVKFFLFGSLDQSKRIVAHTKLSIGGRPLETRVTKAALAHDELRFVLGLSAPGQPPRSAAR